MSDRALLAPATTDVAVDHAGAVSEADAASFHTARPRLFGIAFRVLGSANEADDVVQDAWIRWQDTDCSKVRDPAAFLAATTMRLAINVTQSAWARRETHIDSQLFDPVDAGADPALGAEQREALELAVRILLEQLLTADVAAGGGQVVPLARAMKHEVPDRVAA